MLLPPAVGLLSKACQVEMAPSRSWFSAVRRAAGRLLQLLPVIQHGGQHAGTSIHEMLRQPPTANSLRLRLQLAWQVSTPPPLASPDHARAASLFVKSASTM